MAASSANRTYHHGSLRRAILDAATDAIAREGVAGLSLRALARDAGVSHAAPLHHFGDKTGLLTAIATEGFELLARALGDAWTRTESFLEVGVAYVAFATEHPAHFDVMFRPELYRADDPDLVRATEAATAMLYGKVEQASGKPRRSKQNVEAAIAAWALMHGLATLWLQGNLPSSLAKDPSALARRAGKFLFAG